MKKNRKKKSDSFSFSDFGNVMDGDSDFGLSKKGELPTLFLGKFNEEGLREVMEKVGLTNYLYRKGFDDLRIEIKIDTDFIHHFRVYSGEKNPDNLMIDLRVTETKFLPEKRFFDKESDRVAFDMIVIEWLSIENPTVKFSSDKPQLPGQGKPGLGILKFCFDMMYVVAKKVTKDGFLDVPDHLHGAIMYSKKFNFFDPVTEGVLQAIQRDLSEYSLSDISWGMITNTIIEKYKNAPQQYKPSEQIFYTSDRMRKYFHSSKYRSIFQKYFKRKKYHLDYDLMEKRREEILSNKKIVDM